MAITKTWTVQTMQRDASDGHVNIIIYSVVGTVDGVEKGTFAGEISLPKPSSLPSDFVAYDSLTESTVINWVKAEIGSERVSEIEKQVEDGQVYGKPF